MRGLIKRILNEETKVTDKINRLIHKVFPDTMVYGDYFTDYDDFGYEIKIAYKLSDHTIIREDEFGGVKPYEGEIWFDIIKMESTSQESDGGYNRFYYKDAFPEFVWNNFEEELYEKISPFVDSFLYFDIEFSFKTR
jgi:hypothetical protein